MRYVLLVKGDPAPSQHGLGAYADALSGAGILLAAEGLRPPSTDGITACFLIDVRSTAEAAEWASRCPVDASATARATADIEIREVVELSGTG